jgi:hypothetical protein
MSNIVVCDQFPSIVWFGALGDFVSAILSFIVLVFLQLEYRANKFLRHKDQLYQLEKDLMNVEVRLISQSKYSSFSAFITKILFSENLEEVLNVYPDLKRYAMLYEEIIVRTDNRGVGQVKQFNMETRLSLRRKLTRNEKALLIRLNVFCPKASNYFNS